MASPQTGGNSALFPSINDQAQIVRSGVECGLLRLHGDRRVGFASETSTASLESVVDIVVIAPADGPGIDSDGLRCPLRLCARLYATAG